MNKLLRILSLIFGLLLIVTSGYPLLKIVSGIIALNYLGENNLIATNSFYFTTTIYSIIFVFGLLYLLIGLNFFGENKLVKILSAVFFGIIIGTLISVFGLRCAFGGGGIVCYPLFLLSMPSLFVADFLVNNGSSMATIIIAIAINTIIIWLIELIIYKIFKKRKLI